jgi:thiamine-monophosphate kinase
VALGTSLARERLATAAIDVSDGLGVDAARLARASGVRLSIDRDRLPISTALAAFAGAEGLDPVELAVGGGDDYELLFTVREADAPRVAERAAALEVPISAIGIATPGAGVVLVDAGGERDIGSFGHDHFETAR